jgi:DNA replication ATP-dependent helicase Dna2
MRRDLLNFIERESDAEEREIMRTHRAIVADRVKAGNCIVGLKFLRSDNDGFYFYSYRMNNAKFREGDLLVINEHKQRGKAILDEGVLVWLDQIDRGKKVVKLDRAIKLDLPETSDCTLDLAFYDFNSARLKHSVDIAYESDDIPTIIEGRASTCLPSQLCKLEAQRLRDKHPDLTSRQCLAAVSAKTEQTTLIQGPPGSGKSFLLALIIEEALSSGKSVLATAPSHRAIENLLAAVQKRGINESIIKIEPRDTRQRGDGILRVTAEDCRLKLAEAPYLVGTTVYQAYKLFQEKTLNFDLIVIDEAGQMPVAHGVPALLHGGQCVVAGDHKQLAPIIKDPMAHPEHLRLSLFEHLHERYGSSTILLNTTFRMNSGLAEFPSKCFYSKELVPAPNVSSRKFKPARIKCGEFYDVISREESVTYIELDHRAAMDASDDEAELVAKLARTLIESHGVDPKELAIMSPLKRHNENIRTKLQQLIDDDGITDFPLSSLVIDTVNRMQGQEREVTIFSLCASSRRYLIDRAPFLYDPHRLNVAITRSKTRLFVVGSKYFFPHNSSIIIDARHLRIWESYYRYLVENRHRVVHRARRFP